MTTFLKKLCDFVALWQKKLSKKVYLYYVISTKSRKYNFLKKLRDFVALWQTNFLRTFTK